METQDKIHNPLFAELFRIALPQLEGYQSRPWPRYLALSQRHAG